MTSYKAYLEPNPNNLSHDVNELEEISFTFQRIEIENKDGKTMAVDDWFQRG